MTKQVFPVNSEHALGAVGLLLLILVGKLAERGQGPQQTFAVRVSGWMARRAIDVIALIGWLVDRLPEPAVMPSRPPRATRAPVGVRT